MEPKYTPDGLPVVTEQTYESTISSIGKDLRLNESLGAELIRKIKRENPFINQVLENLVKTLGECDFVDGVNLGLISAYELLRRQSEANKLNEASSAQ